eukprot:s7405_g5.t3
MNDVLSQSLTFWPKSASSLQIAAASAPQALPATTFPEAVSSRHPSDMTSATQISQVLFMIQLPPHSYLCLNRDSDSDPDIDDDSDRDMQIPSLPRRHQRQPGVSLHRPEEAMEMPRSHLEGEGFTDIAPEREPGKPGPRRMPSNLNEALARLHSILEVLPKGWRRTAIEGLSKQLRHELIEFVEGTKKHRLRHVRPAAKARAVKPSVKSGSVWTSGRASAQHHRARCQIGGVLVRSSSVRCREQAEVLLQRLRAALSEVPEALEHRLPAAAAALSKSCTVSFVVTLDARRWIGRSLESPTLHSLAETLSWRRRAAEAEAGGWPLVKALWMEWMQTTSAQPRAFQRSRRSAREVHRLVAAGDVCFSGKAAKKRARQVASDRRLARRLRAAVTIAEALLGRAMVPKRSSKSSTRTCEVSKGRKRAVAASHLTDMAQRNSHSLKCRCLQLPQRATEPDYLGLNRDIQGQVAGA